MSYDYSDFSNYSLKDTIGEGNFGKVKLAIFIPTGNKFAVKILNKKKLKDKMKKSILNENEIIKKFNHINVIYVYQIIDLKDEYFIVMEYCEKGELFDYIVEHKRLEEDEASIFFYQLINGLEHIHQNNIAHRDLKPENLLLNKNKLLKIIDFGLSHVIHNKSFLKTKCGSPSYASPEIITQKYYDGFKSDIWCCGIILYAMLCGYLPFDGENNDELFKNILICNPQFPEFLSEKSKTIISKILNPNPSERVTIEEIKKDDFYLKGKELCDIDYNMVEKNILNNRIMNKNNDIKKKIRNLKILNKETEANIFLNKLMVLNSNVHLKLKKNKNRFNTNSMQSEIMRKHINRINLSNNVSNENTRNNKNTIFSPTSSTKNGIKSLNRGTFREFSPKFSLKELMETKNKKRNIPYLNNTNFVYNNINLNRNKIYLNGKNNKTKIVKTTISPFERKIHLSKKSKLKNSPLNSINNNLENNINSNNYDSSRKKTFNIIMNNMVNLKIKKKHIKRNSETISAISNISNYTNPNYSNNHNKSSSRDEKIISHSTRRDIFNYLPVLKNHY